MLKLDDQNEIKDFEVVNVRVFENLADYLAEDDVFLGNYFDEDDSESESDDNDIDQPDFRYPISINPISFDQP